MTTTFGQRMKEMRQKKGLKQEEIADQIGISRPMIGNYENDKNEPSISDLKRIAALLDTTVAYLIGEIDLPDKDALERLKGELSFSTSDYVPKDQFAKLEEKVDALIDYVGGNTDAFKKKSQNKIDKKWDTFKAKLEKAKQAGKELGDNLQTREAT